MFYEERINANNLRFGDVVQGFIETIPHIENPLSNSVLKGYEYKVETRIPEFSVIITPCCSIKDNTVCLTPLERITSDIYRNLNEEIIKDFTILNTEVEQEDIISSFNWNLLSDDEKRKKKNEGKALVFIDKYFYKSHDFFEKYEIHLRGEEFFIDDYVIDFKDTFRIKCNKIIYQKVHTDILSAKSLELSKKARNDFRIKLSSYYARIPDEDII